MASPFKLKLLLILRNDKESLWGNTWNPEEGTPYEEVHPTIIHPDEGSGLNNLKSDWFLIFEAF
jgi:hypothetical protein